MEVTGSQSLVRLMKRGRREGGRETRSGGEKEQRQRGDLYGQERTALV